MSASSTIRKEIPYEHPLGCRAIVAGAQIALSDRGQISRRLRVSVVRHCNFGCFFCHNEGQGPLTPVSDGLSAEQFGRLCGAAIVAGISEIKLTGGEPLLYRHDGKDVIELVRAIAARRVGHAVGLSMTTNGLLLDKYAEALRGAGLDRVTISLHTLQEETLRQSIHRRGSDKTIDRVLDGIAAAAAAGLEPLKVNTVLFGSDGERKGNLSELPALVEMCRDRGVNELRLYTLLSHEGFSGKDFSGRYRFWEGSTLAAVAEALGDTREHSKEVASAIRNFVGRWAMALYPKPTLRLDVGGLIVCIEAMEDGRFAEADLSAEGSYALRLSSNGMLRGSLESKHTIPLAKLIRDGADDREIQARFAEARRTLLPPPQQGTAPAASRGLVDGPAVPSGA